MALVPKDLLEQIADLEKLFIVTRSKLIEISDHFVSELEKGAYFSYSDSLNLVANTQDCRYKEGVLYFLLKDESN